MQYLWHTFPRPHLLTYTISQFLPVMRKFTFNFSASKTEPKPPGRHKKTPQATLRVSPAVSHASLIQLRVLQRMNGLRPDRCWETRCALHQQVSGMFGAYSGS